MSHDKAIKSGKEHRKQYTGAKACDCTCRNHGSCAYCLRNRLYKFRDKKPALPEDIDDYFTACCREPGIAGEDTGVEATEDLAC